MQTAGYIVITVFYSHCYFTLFEVVEASVGLSALRSNSKGESKPQTDGQIAGRTDKRTDGRTDRTGIHILIATVSHSSSPLTRQPSVRTWSGWTELSWPTEFLRIIVIVNYCDIYSRILFFIFFLQEILLLLIRTHAQGNLASCCCQRLVHIYAYGHIFWPGHEAKGALIWPPHAANKRWPPIPPTGTSTPNSVVMPFGSGWKTVAQGGRCTGKICFLFDIYNLFEKLY